MGYIKYLILSILISALYYDITQYYKEPEIVSLSIESTKDPQFHLVTLHLENGKDVSDTISVYDLKYGNHEYIIERILNSGKKQICKTL